MRLPISLLAGLLLVNICGSAQRIGDFDTLMANAVMAGTDTGKAPRWTYEEGLLWKGLESCWYNTGDARYFNYIQRQIDRLVDEDGNILSYRLEDYDLDNILCGRLLLLLYKVTNQEKYYKAASQLRRQLREQPRTDDGSFWHKKKNTQQVGLDGLYMAQPFYAEWAAAFHEDSAFNDIARQLELIGQHARDRARAMGWYGMALVDVLEYFPADHAERGAVLKNLDRWAAAVTKVQDPATGIWWDVLDKGGAPGNFLEASASSMFVYALEKAVRMGWLPESYRAVAEKGYGGVVKNFIKLHDEGEKVVTNDPKGLGAFLLAGAEMQQLSTLGLGKGHTVLLDYYFDNEHKEDITGASVRWHYVWEDEANSGFSFLGSVFRRHGLRTDSLSVAPTAERLKRASVYIIVDPDNEKESPVPNYPSAADIQAVHDWVKAGGVLVLMSNDSANAEFLHFNKLAEAFGIHFNLDDKNRVAGNNYEQGAFIMTGRDGIFKTAHKVYIKELSTLRLSDPAKARYISKSGDVIMATAKIGKGTVFAVGDPWFYNEYLDGRKLPAEYENFRAANDLVKWIITEINVL